MQERWKRPLPEKGRTWSGLPSAHYIVRSQPSQVAHCFCGAHQSILWPKRATKEPYPDLATLRKG